MKRNLLFNQLTAIGKRLAMVLTMLLVVGIGQVWGAEATISTFTSTSGKFGDVSYNAYKGGGTSNPAVNSSAIRLYQNSNSTTGGYIVLSVPDGYTITSATIKSTMATTTGYYIDSNPGATTPAKANFEVSNKSLSANTAYTVSGLSTQYITFACFGTSSSSRLYLSYLSVTYESPAQSYDVVLYRNNEVETIENVASGTPLDDIDGNGEQGGCAEWSFVGWSKSQRSDQDDSTPMDRVTEVDGAGPYYAVYSHTADAGGGLTTQTMTTFTSTSGNIGGDANVSYAAEKGNASTAPAVNDEEIRIYQNGGTLTITGNNGKKLTSITIGSSMKTSVSYKIDGGSESSTQSITAGGKYTLSDINATSVLFTCKGTDKNSRLYLNHLSVTYSGGNTVYYTTSPECNTETTVYTITYNTDGGTINEDYVKNYTEGVGATLPTDVTKTGYTFDGWYNNNELTGNKVTAIGTSETGNKEFWAKWTAITYTVTLNQKSGSNGTESISATYDATMPNITVPTRTGYTFGGYWTNEDGTGTQYYNQSGGAYNNKKWDQATDATLYAKWTANKYTVKFNGNNNTGGSMSDQSFTYDTPQNLTTNAFTRIGYTFNGWNTNASGSGTSYTDGQEVINLNSTSGGQITLYAQWTELPKYTVSFSTGTGNPTQAAIKEATGGAGITLPAGPAPTCTDWTFAGWAEASVEEKTTSPGELLTANSNYKPTSNCTLYAVYSKPTGVREVLCQRYRQPF